MRAAAQAHDRAQRPRTPGPLATAAPVTRIVISKRSQPRVEANSYSVPSDGSQRRENQSSMTDMPVTAPERTNRGRESQVRMPGHSTRRAARLRLLQHAPHVVDRRVLGRQFQERLE